MYEVFNTQISDVKASANQMKSELNGKIIDNKAELQRQLDMIMRDRKLVERGGSQ
jgi:flagellar biosynthesis regulator FlaF